jgi:tryptophan synthase alpha chain
MPLADALFDARANARPAIVPYLLVDRDRTSRVDATVRAFLDAGATALELGFPFSDPIADGPVLAAASGRALARGTRWSDLLVACRRASAILPVAVMTYANPIWARGVPAALRDLAGAGATGLVVPDLSLEESPAWRTAARRAGLSLVLLAAPGVAPERLHRIARASQGFLYLVGHYGTTGAAADGSTVDLRPIIARARTAAPELPLLIGFGIRDRRSVRWALDQGADGVVIATALEERIARGARPPALGAWLRGLLAPSGTSSGA